MTERYPILSSVEGPADLKQVSLDRLPELATEVADLIKAVVQESGGHYSSPLGVVDLTVALHAVFDSPRDKLVWDVGHQAYAHKILTGRWRQFHTLRSKDGISGFLSRAESDHDAFGAGHASTAISAALGMAQARDLNGEEGHVVAIVGDGAMTGGLAYEGLNNLGFKKLNMTVVLNDNRMSISPSVGSLSDYLTRIVSNPLYNRIRDDIWKATGLLPLGTKAVRSFFRRLEEGLKAFLTPGLIFEELGVRYLGHIDGHDYDAMIKVFNNVKDLPFPTLVHVLTTKGHGAREAEDDSQRYYSLSGRKSQKPNGKAAPDYSSVFGSAILELGATDKRICCVTAAMEIGTGLSRFAEEFPDRYFDVGIAEAHAVTFAGGLATKGRRPVVAIYSTFLQRAYDQIVHDIALQDLPVIFCLDRAGVVGPDGPTHHGVFDLAFLRTIPGLVVCAPKDGDELRHLLFSAVEYDAPVAIRYPKDGSVKFDPDGQATLIRPGTWEILQEGGDVTLLAVGSMVGVARQAAEELLKQFDVEVTVINCRFVKPLDEPMLTQLAESNAPMVTIEEGVLAGGFGSAVRDFLAQRENVPPVTSLGIGDAFVEQATRQEILDMLGLTPAKVADRVMKLLSPVVAPG
ncbi:MAG: 1-deoxy-D-xylulose-5-phosphate synthase [Candidatus Neomarinimicrobiota bacterium]